MLQIIQDLKNGDTTLEKVPVPKVKEGEVLIRSHSSLVSLGTERMVVEFGKAGLLGKVRQQPERVKEVLAKMKTDGIMPTIEAVRRKLDMPISLGYSNAGTVVEVGNNVSSLKVGDRVVSNGCHAEYVRVPENLVAKIPDSVTFEEASFTVVGAIALQGIRLADPTFGETVVVMGLGLIGLLAAQLLKANGCKVIGVDLDTSKLDIAEQLGIETINASTNDPVKGVKQLTNGIGVDAVIIAASSQSDEVISQSAKMSRKRGRIVLVGVVGLDINRSDFFEKELTFQVSCSYGPGRYDPEYEEKGHDYPLPYVRWTEQRNFEAVLEAIRSDQLNVNPLITEKVALEDISQIYGEMSDSDSIASLITYPQKEDSNSKPNRSVHISDETLEEVTEGIAIVGAGNFTQSTILPSLQNGAFPIKYIVSSQGLSSTQMAKKFNIEQSTTDFNKVLEDPSVQGVLITTRHNQHAPMVIKALNAGKHVFVEKPLALNNDELEEIIEAKEASGKSVSVGFNRRFSPHTRKMKELIGNDPTEMNIVATMNAGFIPEDSWVQDPDIGGGRIVGEACHYVDLIQYLTGSLVESVYMQGMGQNPKSTTDNASILLKMENGSTGVINYFSNGNKSYSKERIEVFYQGKNLILDNFRKLYGYGYGGLITNRLLKTKQDKGHKEQFERLAQSWKEGGSVLIPFNEIVNTTRSTFATIQSLKTQQKTEVK
ncbi:bi-domain-containing oxidoreductase [Aliifodinibius salicampi]|uniref:Bi-domain-containing oxidoreductase n=1 Tax=Fodinibius salicampi TaxID=1920655 RepID=A0ABT3PV48_9BACT|nr:bi-domain-containing oxidoreductase [Fodinibius salicampi]MCW9711724.1 bi-domain-containing oxidoreductase [Fodinibius salicampi]